MSTKELFDNTYLHLKRINQKLLDQGPSRMIDPANGLPLESYYEYTS